MFDIEDTVPPPTTTQKDPTGARSRYPAGALDVGQSFFVPADGAGTDVQRLRRRMHSVCGQVRRRQRLQGLPMYRFVCEIRQEADRDGVRVWRTE